MWYRTQRLLGGLVGPFPVRSGRVRIGVHRGFGGEPEVIGGSREVEGFHRGGRGGDARGWRERRWWEGGAVQTTTAKTGSNPPSRAHIADVSQQTTRRTFQSELSRRNADSCYGHLHKHRIATVGETSHPRPPSRFGHSHSTDFHRSVRTHNGTLRPKRFPIPQNSRGNRSTSPVAI